MEIPQRSQRVGPPTYRQPVSTIRAEEHAHEARQIQYKTHMFTSVLDLGQQAISVFDKVAAAKEATDLMKAETTVFEMQQEFSRSLYNYEEPEKSVPYDEWEQRTKEINETIKETVLSEMSLPRSKEEFEKRYERIASEFTNKMAWEVQRRMELEAEADFEASYKSVLTNNSMTDDEKRRKALEYIAGAEAAELITPKEADRKRAEVESVIAFTNIYREMQGILTTMGPEEARAYLYSDKCSALSEEGLTKLEKVIERFEKEKLDGVIFDLAVAESNGELTYQMIDNADIPMKGQYGKLWWRNKLDKRAKEEAEENKKAQEKAEYTSRVNAAIDEAKTVDVTDQKNVDDFITGLEKRDFKDGDRDDIRRVVNARRRTYEAEQREIEEDEEEAEERAEEERERLQDEDYFKAYEAIRTKAITSKDGYRDKREYPHLTDEDKIKLDKYLESTQTKSESIQSDQATLEWLAHNYGNPDITNEEFKKYVLDNHDNLMGRKGKDYLDWVKDAGKRDVTKIDSAREPAMEIFDIAYKVFKEKASEEELIKLEKEMGYTRSTYLKWLAENADLKEEQKIEKAHDMVAGFKTKKIEDILEGLVEQRGEAEGASVGLTEFRQKYGEPDDVEQKGKYEMYAKDNILYRYDPDKERLEYYDQDKEKWRKAK